VTADAIRAEFSSQAITDPMKNHGASASEMVAASSLIQITVLAEIAAQLAELNENLRLARGMRGDPR